MPDTFHSFSKALAYQNRLEASVLASFNRFHINAKGVCNKHTHTHTQEMTNLDYCYGNFESLVKKNDLNVSIRAGERGKR